MNLTFSNDDKIRGFSIFGWVWLCGAIIIVWQTQSLHYPLATSLVAATVPLVIRIVFDYGNIHRVLTGRNTQITE